MPRLYIGNLPRNVEERDVKRFFRDYGRLRGVDLKNGYGFVEVEDRRDADDAIHDLDGSKMLGERVTVEMARSSMRGGGDRDRDRGDRDRGGDRGGYRAARFDSFDNRDRFNNSRKPIRSEHRVVVEELSTRVSWQDLKDLMRKVGEVTFADAHKLRPNEGVVEFSNQSDMKAAIEKYNGYELHGYKLKVYADKRNSFKKRSKSRSNRRSSSGSGRSGSRSRSRSVSKKSSSRRRSRSRHRSSNRKRSLSKTSKKSNSRKKSMSFQRSVSRNSASRSPKLETQKKTLSKSRSNSNSIKKDSNNVLKDSKSASKDSMSKSRSKTRSKSRSKSGGDGKSQSESRSVSKSISRSRSVSKSRSHTKSGTKSRSHSKSGTKSQSKSPHENGLHELKRDETMDSN